MDMMKSDPDSNKRNAGAFFSSFYNKKVDKIMKLARPQRPTSATTTIGGGHNMSNYLCGLDDRDTDDDSHCGINNINSN